jgi:hypothetical protein
MPPACGIGSFILKDQFPGFFNVSITRCTCRSPGGSTDVRPVAPNAVGQEGEFLQEGLRVVEDLAHTAFDGFRAIALDERKNPVPGGDVAGELGAEVERHRRWLARAAQVELFDVPADLVVLDDLDRRDENALVKGVARRGAEAAGRDAADVVLVQAVRHPAEELALVEHRAEQHHVHLVRGADPGIVGEEHVAVADAGVVAAVLERPLHLSVGDAGHVLHVRAEIDKLGILGEDRGVQVERVHRHRRPREALDGRAVLLVHVPQRVPDHFERDRIDALLGFPVKN